MKRYLVFAIFSIGCSSESFQVGDSNEDGSLSDSGLISDTDSGSSADIEIDQQSDSWTDSSDSFSPPLDSGKTDSGVKDSSPIDGDGGACDSVINLCGGCGDSCTITGVSSKPFDDTPCHIWYGVKCSIYLAPGSYKLGCVVCTGPNTMKCQEC